MLLYMATTLKFKVIHIFTFNISKAFFTYHITLSRVAVANAEAEKTLVLKVRH